MFDLILKGGWVIDGTGAPRYRADVAVDGEKIAAVGSLAAAKAKRIVDVDGRIVCPGFIDAHVHGDLALLVDPTHEAAIFQGVTTYIIGQDGCGFAPASPTTIEYMRRYTAGFSGWFPELVCDWKNLEEYFARFHRKTSINIAFLVPNGTVRMEVMGLEDRPSKPRERAAMHQMLREAMDAGAVGLSTGLDYIPSIYADTEELTDLCKSLVPYDGVYVTHVRGSASGGWNGALDEVFAIGAGSGCKLHVSHFNVKAELHLPRIDAARSAGLDVTYDTYPYLAGMTLLAMIGLPSSLQLGGPEPTLQRLRDSACKPLIEDFWTKVPYDPRNVRLAGVDSPKYAHLAGLSLAEAAERSNVSLADFIRDVLLESRLVVNCIIFDVKRTENDMLTVMRHPAQMSCSDGIYWGAFPHPRGWGSFAKFVGYCVRDRKAWSLEEAVRHLTSHPAERFQLPDRGLIEVGKTADLVVFDADEIRDRSTYSQPRELAEGVQLVLVGGQVAMENGRHTGSTNGQVLRRRS